MVFREYLVQISHFQTRDEQLGEVELPRCIYDSVIEVKIEGRSPNSFSSTNTDFFPILYYTILSSNKI